MMDWLFGRRKSEPVPEVKEAVEKRDKALRVLDEAIDEVDQVHGRVVEDYESAERARRRK